ncbi:hypothetical protein QVD17_18261 [Tagetes erecta]|uniref:Cytochrome P450 n=1 Tax=Tagetes erecta TaxID=13708 RepID=A0AAD8KH91_TARER|nr:hypothetical protein QVD17_18261 [Tagetes erecta]
MIVLEMGELYLLVKNNYDIILAVLLSGLVTSFLTKKLKKSSLDAIPGRLGLPLVGESFSFLSATNSTKGCYDFVRLRRQKYGKWFKTRLFGKVHVFVPSVVGAKAIFTNDFQLFNKGYIKSMADAVGKKSLLCVPVESHKRIRRLLSSPFSMDSMSKYVHKFDKLISERLKNLADQGKCFVVLDFNMKIAFDEMCDMLMSITDESLLNKLEKDCVAVSNAMLSFPVMIPGTAYYKGIKARENLMTFLEEMITSRRSSKERHEDFLQSMLDRDSFPDDEKLDDLEIMDNLLTFILAGQSTTAAAMMWAVKFLDENQDVQNKLREEQLSIRRNKPPGDILCLEDLNKMSYGLKVMKETLRMSNVLLWFPRVALDDCKIQDFEIKKGWHVDIDATHIHYDPELYKDPLQFNPSRFDESHKPYSYIPFGSGPRTCLGMNMAKVMMLVFLYRLTSGYTWTVEDQDLSLEKKSHIPRLKSGVPITLTALKDDN